MTATFTWTLVGLLLCARGISRRYWRRQLDEALVIHQFRDSFAQTRRNAVRLLSTNQLEPESATFAFLYMVSSSLVRRTHAYPEFARFVIRRMAEPDYGPGSELIQRMEFEMRSWTPDVREAFNDLNRTIRRLIFENYAPMRVARWLERMQLLGPLQRVLLKYYSDAGNARRLADESVRLEQHARTADALAA